MLESVLNWIEPNAPLNLILLLCLCSLGFPFSKGLALLLGGVVAYRGRYSLPEMVLSGLLGLHLGDCLYYYLGRKWGHHLLEWRLFKKWVKPQYVAKALEMVDKHGPLTLILARLTPYVRTACYICLGSLNLKQRTFHAINLVACLVYAGVFVLMGYALGGQVQTLTKMGLKGNLLVSAFLILFFGLSLIPILRKRNSAASLPTPE